MMTCTGASDACTLEEDDDPCVVDRQLDGQDDSTNVSADISHTIDVFTSQQSGDTSEESHMLVPRDDELPMGAMTHLSLVQTPMIATSHEGISGSTCLWCASLIQGSSALSDMPLTSSCDVAIKDVWKDDICVTAIIGSSSSLGANTCDSSLVSPLS